MRALSQQEEELASSIGIDPYEPAIGPSSVSAPSDEQSKFDAWIAAGGYEDDEFKAFFGLYPDDETLH